MEQELPLLVVATRNAHKTGEIRAMLAGKWEVKDLSDYPQAPPVDETGVTFTENATLKALSASKCIPGVLLADDSGLDRKSTRLNSSHTQKSRMPSSA